jgi:RNA polymerase sigma-70 factor, ECF subfamily
MSTSLPKESASPYAQLLDRARRLDRQAFAELYDASHRRIFGYLLVHVGERGAAEDLLQDVYLAAFQNIPRFRGRTEAEFMAWLLKIAHRKSVDRLRYRYRHPEVVAADPVPTSQAADPLDMVDERINLREISGALARLTDDQREVVVSRLVMGYNLEETGRLMHKNVGAIKALQHRALASLAKFLGPGGSGCA